MSFNILVLGGTQMLGRDFVGVLSNMSQYNITIANRGLTNPSLFPNIKHITIDRNDSANCESLVGEKYDYIVDFSCYNIDQFNNTFNYLSYDRYLLISTQSVLDTRVLNEGNSLDTYYQYCLLKKQLEDFIINNENIKNITIARPCAVYGEHDYTNRFEKRGDDFFWKQSNNTRASKETGCIYIEDLTQKLVELLQKPQNERVHTYNIG
jgi:nucleoside-diphosphate-sugar epimerase